MSGIWNNGVFTSVFYKPLKPLKYEWHKSFVIGNKPRYGLNKKKFVFIGRVNKGQ